MSDSSKKQVSNAAKNLNNSRKFFSILIMIFVVTSTLTTVVSSNSISLASSQNNIENQSSSIEPEIKIIQDSSLKDKLPTIKERFISIVEKISTIKNRSSVITDDLDSGFFSREINIKSSASPVLRAFERIFRLNLLNITIFFYTNYSDIVKQTPIKFLQEKKIDVNDDGKKDIKVKLGLSFSIFRLSHFSINFKFIVTRLADFPDVNAHFEAYAEIYLPGLLPFGQKGDRISFGYESPADQEVPKTCQITYRFLPNIVYLRKTPEHRIEINPGKNAANSKLNLLLSYTNFGFNQTVKSAITARVSYNPAVKSAISVGGKGLLGGLTYQFKKQLSEASQVDMYFSLEKGNKTIIGYVKDLPKKITFTQNLGIDGSIKFNTYNQAPSEIGLVDDLYYPQNKVYFTNMPSKAELSWNSRLLLLQKINVNFFTDSPGIQLKGDFKISNNTTANLNVFSKENLDSEMELDFKNGNFVFERNKVDVSVNVLFNKPNASLDFSTNISSFCDEPFKIFFGKLFDGNLDILFCGSYLEIADLKLNLLKVSTNGTRGDESSEPLDEFLSINLSSLRFTSRDFIKITKEPKTNNFYLSAGTNGSISINNLDISSKILQLQLGLFEIASDHLYGTAVNVSTDLSNMKNLTVEYVSLENSISKFIIDGFAIKLNLMDTLILDEFRMNFSGTGTTQLTYSNSSANLNGAIIGPGLFELDVLKLVFVQNTTNLVKFVIEDFNMSGPITFFVHGSLMLDKGNITNYDFSAGVNSNWHLGKLYFEALLPIIEIIDFNGVGQVSGGLEKCPFGGIFDIALSVSGSWDWKKLYFVPLSEEMERPGLHFGSFYGNVSLVLHFPNLKKLGNGHMGFNVYSTTKLDQIKFEYSNWSISAFSFNMNPGVINISWINLFDTSNLHFLIDNSETVNFEFDSILYENKISGVNFSIKSREIMVPHLEIATNLDGDGDGFLYLDSDNQYCNFEITRSNLIKINKTFKAENFNISWNFNGGLFNIIDTQGYIQFGAEFSIMIFFNTKWRVLLSINQPVADFTFSPPEPQINETIQFDGSISYFSGPITRYDWKWNSTDVWHNNLGPTPTHSYTENGSYKVTLRVWSGLKHSTTSKIVEVGEGQKSLNIFCQEETIMEGDPFNIIILDNNVPLTGVQVTYAQQDSEGNWQNATNITDSQGVVSFTAFNVPEGGSMDYCDAKIYIDESGCFDIGCKWFQVYDASFEFYI